MAVTDSLAVQRGYHAMLRELMTLNDVQYQRYRLAFKFRKLQKNLHLEYGNVNMLSEVLHLTGVQGLHRGDVIPLPQLSSVLNELYEAIRTTRPVLSPSQLQDAQVWAHNWLQHLYRTSSGGSIEVTHLRVVLCLFMGSKVADKARFIFGQLANVNGAVEKEEMKLFVRVLRQLAYAMQENVDYKNVEKIFQECLISVRDSEDIEEEQLDGGIRRQWLSLFEFTKLLSSSSSAPSFLSWLLLWFNLPAYENVVHSVRCSVCARKPIVCFRYQCTQCHNYHMCQMCFLKGRTSDRHHILHKVLEFSNKGRSSSRSWHRLLGKGAAMGGRVVSESRGPFSFTTHSRSQSTEDIDNAPPSLEDMIKPVDGNTPLSSEDWKGSHAPAIIRIGSDSKPLTPKKSPSRPPQNSGPPVVTETTPAAHTLHTSPARRVSSTASGSSSPDSLSSAGGTAGGKFSFEGARNSRGSPPHLGVVGVKPSLELRQGVKHTTSDGTATVAAGGRKKTNLLEENRRLSREVDQILMDLPPPTHYSSASLPLRGHTHSFGRYHSLDRHDDTSLQSNMEGIQKEEQELKVQVSQLTDKREKLSHDLQDLLSQVQQMHVGFQTLGHKKPATRSWSRLLTPPTAYHVRSDSAPIQSPSPTSSSPENSLPTLTETEISPEATALVARRKNKEQEAEKTRASVYTPDLTSSSVYPDPLTEYNTDTDKNVVNGLCVHDTTDHRLSVAW